MILDFLRNLPIPGLKSPRPFVSVLRLNGVIASGGRFGAGLNIAGLADTIERAFSPGRLDAVALVINSPGGSPVQSNLIAKRIRQLAEEKGVPVFAFVEDVAASGGYMLACAADEIFADESSIVGSIGVISAGFGFDQLIEKVGIERRVHTAGESKSILDPFQPERPEDVARLEAVQRDVHEMFKDLVRTRRGDKLDAANDRLFTGEFWVAGEGVKLGLIDGIGDIRSVMRRRFGDKVRLRPFSAERPVWRSNATPGVGVYTTGRLPGLAGLADNALAALDARALWARFGL